MKRNKIISLALTVLLAGSVASPLLGVGEKKKSEDLVSEKASVLEEVAETAGESGSKALWGFVCGLVSSKVDLKFSGKIAIMQAVSPWLQIACKKLKKVNKGLNKKKRNTFLKKLLIPIAKSGVSIAEISLLLGAGFAEIGSILFGFSKARASYF